MTVPDPAPCVVSRRTGCRVVTGGARVTGRRQPLGSLGGGPSGRSRGTCARDTVRRQDRPLTCTAVLDVLRVSPAPTPTVTHGTSRGRPFPSPTLWVPRTYRVPERTHPPPTDPGDWAPCDKRGATSTHLSDSSHSRRRPCTGPRDPSPLHPAPRWTWSTLSLRPAEVRIGLGVRPPRR